MATRSRLRFTRDVTARVLHSEPHCLEPFYQGDEVMIIRFQDGDVVFAKTRERRVPVLSDAVLEYHMPEAEFEAST